MRSLRLFLALAMLLLAGEAFAQTHFVGTFSAAQERAGVQSEATGTAAAVLTDDGLRFFITVEGLSGEIAAAHFHQAPPGENGGVVRTITDDIAGTTATGLWTADDAEPLDDEALAALLRGDLYLNIHTAANPGGEIRAQLRPAAGTALMAALTPEAEVHDVTSDASGTGYVTLTDAGAIFELTVTDLSGEIAAAHFHQGAAGENGGVVRTITGDFDGNTAIGVWTPSDDEPLTDDLIEDLLTGNLYFNVHTSANQAGEVRGQIGLAGGIGMIAQLDADQEVHDVTSDAEGTASFTLTNAGLVFHLTVSGLSGDIQAAHFHNAPEGMDGPPVRTITGDFAGTTASGVWRFDDDEPLDVTMLQELLNENIYVNIHTADNAAGEIRGQVGFAAGAILTASLTTAQENHDVTGADEAAGTAIFSLDEGEVAFAVTVDGLSGDIAAAHFHEGALGANGPPVRTITDDFDGTTAFGIWTGTDAEPLTEELIAALMQGGLYLNVHTADNGAGELRGQIYPSEGIGLKASITAAQEEPPVTGVEAAGTAVMTLTVEGLVFRATVDGLSGDIAAAHFHEGALGETGPPVRTITDDIDGTTAAGFWTGDDAEPLDSEEVIAALLGDLYLNFHTAANPPGEVRGQVVPHGGVEASAVRLNAAQEVHEVMSDGQGTGSVVFNAAGFTFRLTVDDLSGDVAAAHFHEAPVGVDGPVVFDISGFFDGQSAEGIWLDDITVQNVNAFLAGDLYLNVHTAANPMGEIRGQVNPGADVITPIEPIDELPSTFTLAQNYPNPFNPTTAIPFALDAPAHARLAVYNVLGQRVATLLDGPLLAGTYEARFDAAGLPTGVYFYTLTAGTQQQTRTMMLVK